MMIHHVREIQLRLLAVVGVLILGMAIGYVFHEPLFDFIKAPLNAPLHYMSPAGSFTFIIKICLMIGVIAALPVAVYNAIMFVQPALTERLSRMRVYVTTFASLLLATAGAAFAYLIIIPLALRFFYKFQVDGLVALISADEYLRFVVGVIITFVLIFQLPLLISLIDHIKPLPPRKLFKMEKYIIVGSVFIGVAVPFALDPMVQLLIASPIILLYNLSIGIVMVQQAARRRRSKRAAAVAQARSVPSVPKRVPHTVEPVSSSAPVAPLPPAKVMASTAQPKKSIDGTIRRGGGPMIRPGASSPAAKRPLRSMSDIRPPMARSDIVAPPRAAPQRRPAVE